MAFYKISMGAAMGGGAPLMAPIPSDVQTLTSDGTAGIEARGGEYVAIYADTAAHVAVGATPVTGTGTGWAVGAGQTIYLGPLARGDKVAVAAI